MRGGARFAVGLAAGWRFSRCVCLASTCPLAAPSRVRGCYWGLRGAWPSFRRADGGPRRVSELLLCVAQAASRADIPLHPSRRARHRAASLGSGAAPSRGRAAPSSATPNGRGRLRGRSSTAAAAGRPSSTRRDDDDVQGVSERAESSYAPLRGAKTPGQHLHHRRGLHSCSCVVVAVALWGNL